jgi:hypothetical protein
MAFLGKLWGQVLGAKAPQGVGSSDFRWFGHFRKAKAQTATKLITGNHMINPQAGWKPARRRMRPSIHKLHRKKAIIRTSTRPLSATIPFTPAAPLRGVPARDEGEHDDGGDGSEARQKNQQ